MISKVRKAVFPAAGLGTRFLPATKASPKEMLPLVDKPIIQYGVEEALHSGIQNMIIVTGRGKSAIEDHFDVSFELEHVLEAKGKKEILSAVRAISDMIPSVAISDIAVISGNPVYGLNAIGGAVAITMKDGFNYQGTEIDVRAGSFGRRQASIQNGAKFGNLASYFAVEAVKDDGWHSRLGG